MTQAKKLKRRGAQQWLDEHAYELRKIFLDKNSSEIQVNSPYIKDILVLLLKKEEITKGEIKENKIKYEI